MLKKFFVGQGVGFYPFSGKKSLNFPSDHFPILIITESQHKRKVKNTHTFRDFSDTNINNFRANLSNINWEDVTSSNDAEHSYNTFTDIFSTLHNLHFAPKTVKFNIKYHKLESWMTKGLLTSRLTKLKLEAISAKTLNPKIRAIARASTEEAVQKLQRAGADAVVSPYITGGRRLAAAALRPQVMDFVDGILTGTDRSFYMEEFLIDPRTCPCVGLSLSQAHLRSRSGALVLAIRRADGTLIGGPTGDTELMAGDLLICMGTAEQLRSLTQILIPMRSDGLRLPKH